jgi:hypothetical protein
VTAASSPGTPRSGAAGRHERHLQRFLAQGRLVALTTRYAVVARSVAPDDENRHAIGCLRCGALSWNPNDVEAHFCSRCGVFHDDG